MLASLFFKGWLIGFSIAMPVGPIGVLCIQHALLRGMLYGLVAGLGAALADAIYGAMAGFGVTVFSNFLTTYQFWFQLGGAIFLWYLGSSIFFSKPEPEKKDAIPLSLWRVFLTTFALTLTNPMTIVCFAGVYAGLGICTAEFSFVPAVVLTLGVLVGSSAWWLLLSCGVSYLGRWTSSTAPTHWLNRISGGIILAFAAIASLAVLQQALSLSEILGLRA